MAKMSLLEMTQSILADMEDDEVNSISDTSSSYSVAQVVIKCYYELVSDLSLPGNMALVQLEALADVTKPNYLKIPESVNKVNWFKYAGEDVRYLNPYEFIQFVNKRDEGQDVTDFGGVTFKVAIDAPPKYWTSFDDTYIVTDSFNQTEDSTLQQSRSAAFVEQEITATLADDFVPDIPSRLFPTLLAKASARCFVSFKGVSNVKEDQSERRGLVRHQNDQSRSNGPRAIDRLPNYAKLGRTSRKSTPSRTG